MKRNKKKVGGSYLKLFPHYKMKNGKQIEHNDKERLVFYGSHLFYLVFFLEKKTSLID